MEINDKMLLDLANKMGMKSGGDETGERVSKAAKMADQLKDKNEDELVYEILQLKKAMKENPEQFQKQIKAVKSLGIMMTENQKNKLNKVIRLLEQE